MRRLVGITLVIFGTMLIVSLQGGCTLLSGVDQLCTTCDLGTSQDNVVPTPSSTQTTDGGGGGSKSNNNNNDHGDNDNNEAIPPVDASVDAPITTPANPIDCDGDKCAGMTPICCLHANGAPPRCTATVNDCIANSAGVALSCATSEDCATGQVCCANAPLRIAMCAATCAGAEKRVLCEKDSQCKPDHICIGPSQMFQSEFCEPF